MRVIVDKKKNKYKNSKHFLLVYFEVSSPIWNCNEIIETNKLIDCYISINSFDTLLQIEKYITYNVFLNLCREAKIYCMQQLKVFVGVDSKYLKNSVNRYDISNSNLPIQDDYYYYFAENVIHLEEFINPNVLKDVEGKIKLYNMQYQK